MLKIAELQLFKSHRCHKLMGVLFLPLDRDDRNIKSCSEMLLSFRLCTGPDFIMF